MDRFFREQGKNIRSKRSFASFFGLGCFLYGMCFGQWELVLAAFAAGGRHGGSYAHPRPGDPRYRLHGLGGGLGAAVISPLAGAILTVVFGNAMVALIIPAAPV
jgi:hypothetical protein